MANPYSGAFTDANGRHVERWDVVEYQFGNRRGVLVEALQDGDATVIFTDTARAEQVKWVRLCKIEPNERQVLQHPETDDNAAAFDKRLP